MALPQFPRLTRHLAPLLLAAALAAPASAQTVVDASDPAIIMEFARGYGSALMEQDDEGAPMIVGRIDGTRYVILFSGAKMVADAAGSSFWRPGQIRATSRLTP